MPRFRIITRETLQEFVDVTRTYEVEAPCAVRARHAFNNLPSNTEPLTEERGPSAAYPGRAYLHENFIASERLSEEEPTPSEAESDSAGTLANDPDFDPANDEPIPARAPARRRRRTGTTRRATF